VHGSVPTANDVATDKFAKAGARLLLVGTATTYLIYAMVARTVLIKTMAFISSEGPRSIWLLGISSLYERLVAEVASLGDYHSA